MTTTEPKSITSEYAISIIDQCVLAYLELSSNAYSHQKVKRICKPFGKQLVDHVHAAWVAKEGEFGSFYLNLDLKLQRAFLQYFGIKVEPDKYHTYDDRIMAQFRGEDYYSIYPKEILLLKRFLLMANNNSLNLIADLPEAEVLQSHLDSSFDKYGNGINWGKYYLHLMVEEVPERMAIVQHAINYS